jgi:hypothetical protein
MQPVAPKPSMPLDHLAQPDGASAEPGDPRPGSPDFSSDDDAPPLATAQGVLFAAALGTLIWVAVLVYLFS